MFGRRHFLALPIPLLVGIGLLAQITPATPALAGTEIPDLTDEAINSNQQYGGHAVIPAKSKKGGKSAGGKWAKATKDSEVMDGMFRVYKGDKTWHLQLNPDQLGQQYILALTVARGIG